MPNEHYFQLVHRQVRTSIYQQYSSVYSKMEEEHEEHLRTILQKLRKHKLYAKFDKCDFYQKEIQYLGHVI